MEALNLSQEQVINLVQAEFGSHMNYFRFDLEDYPMPTRQDYIVYLDKVGNRLEFRNVVASSNDQVQLASWNDILSIYRRATRMSYREDPRRIILVAGMASRVRSLHRELFMRIEKHFSRFECPEDEERALEWVESERCRGIFFHLHESRIACEDAYEIIKSLDRSDVSQQSAISSLTSSFERSLQHLHKILLKYPPVLVKAVTAGGH